MNTITDLILDTKLSHSIEVYKIFSKNIPKEDHSKKRIKHHAQKNGYNNQDFCKSRKKIRLKQLMLLKFLESMKM